MSPLVLSRADVLATAAAPWTGHDTRLIVMVAIAIGVIISLIAVLDFHPFVALIGGSVVLGIGSGTELSKVVDSFSTGMGATLGSTGALIALGAILGKLLADSGGVDRIVDTIGSRSGPRLLPWSMALIAAVIGLPMFFEVGLVLLVPIIVVMAKRTNTPLVLLAVPALMRPGNHARVRAAAPRPAGRRQRTQRRRRHHARPGPARGDTHRDHRGPAVREVHRAPCAQ